MEEQRSAAVAELERLTGGGFDPLLHFHLYSDALATARRLNARDAVVQTAANALAEVNEGGCCPRFKHCAHHTLTSARLVGNTASLPFPS